MEFGRKRRRANRQQANQFFTLESRLVLNAGPFATGTSAVVDRAELPIVESKPAEIEVKPQVDQATQPVVFERAEKSERLETENVEQTVADRMEPAAVKEVRIATVEPAEDTRHEMDLVAEQTLEAEFDKIPVSAIAGEIVMLGDVNLDGIVDLFDIAPFIELYNSENTQAEADINGDGAVDQLDVPLFVALIEQ